MPQERLSARRRFYAAPFRASWLSMEGAVHALGVLLLALACMVALASMLLGIPGTFLIFFAGMLYGWLTDFSTVTYARLAWLLGLAVVAEGLEFISGAWRPGAEKPSGRTAGWALAGSFIGGIVGT